MRLPFRIASLLSLSLCLLSVASAVPTDPEIPLKQLTQDTFSPSTSTGLWLVEFFSPYCIHCKMFRPTWAKLADSKSTAALSFSMAQVDCIAYGDLCREQSVDYYPMIKLFNNGEYIETYQGNRQLDDLEVYVDEAIEKHLPSVDTLPISYNSEEDAVILQEKISARAINVEGQVSVFNSAEEFDAALAEGPMFVKMYAPWCGHCKKLAPIWKQLASSMKGVLTVAEVDCEANQALCRRENVEGYPMLHFYQNGHRLDYRGPRKLEDLESYARRTTAAASGLQPLDVSKLDDLVAAEASMFIYLHDPASKIETEANDLIRKIAIQHAGGAPIYHSTSRLLYDEFNIANSEPVLISLKDHTREPAAYFFLVSVLNVKSTHTLDRFLAIHRFPSSFELTSANFPEVMRTGTSEVVVIAPIRKDGMPNAKDVELMLGQTSKEWLRKPTEPNGKSLPVSFVWMDVEKWEDWLKKTYGWKSSPDASPRVILADHKRLVYYDGANGGKDQIRLVESDIMSALESWGKGKIVLKHSESYITRKFKALHDRIEGVAVLLAEHFVLALLGVVIGLAALFVVMDKWMNSDVQPMRASGAGRREKRPLTNKARLD